MKTFLIKLINVILIVFVLCEYNNVVKYREQKEDILRLNAELENSKLYSGTQQESTPTNMAYTDGIYEGEGKGFGGSIKVKVTIELGMIAKINIESAENEDGAYLNMAKKIVEDIISEQTADVDSISGATFSSGGIKSAVEQALKKAEV